MGEAAAESCCLSMSPGQSEGRNIFGGGRASVSLSRRFFAEPVLSAAEGLRVTNPKTLPMSGNPPRRCPVVDEGIGADVLDCAHPKFLSINFSRFRPEGGAACCI